MEDGTWGSPFLLPDGVTPQRLTIVPGDEPRVYWSFDV